VFGCPQAGFTAKLRRRRKVDSAGNGLAFDNASLVLCPVGSNAIGIAFFNINLSLLDARPRKGIVRCESSQAGVTNVRVRHSVGRLVPHQRGHSRLAPVRSVCARN